MGQTVPFPRHHLYSCGQRPRSETELGRCASGLCMYCSGGLAYCTTCRAGEVELPTECPQRPMHELERAAVRNGHLDFRGARWVCVSEESRRTL